MPRGAKPVRVKLPERRIYSRSKVFGRFGMRVFQPTLMDVPHAHGHIELNFVRHAAMQYAVDDAEVSVPADRLVMFWASVPHQLTAISECAGPTPELYNIYLPLDSFLAMSNIATIQAAMLGGAMVRFPHELCDETQLERWYRDYRSNNQERLDILKLELNATFRRAALLTPDYLRKPWTEKSEREPASMTQARHVVDMVRHVLDHLDEPLHNEDVTRVTGFHPNHALAIFNKIMRVPLKQFIIRMRLMRARSLLVASDIKIAHVAASCGFGSLSQFYHHFVRAYGMTPHALRQQ